MGKKPKVLFLSTGNSTRSQMAGGFLRSYAGETFIAESAGIESASVNPFAAKVMRESGIDVSPQNPKHVAEVFNEHFAYVITLSDMAKEKSPIFPFTTHLLHWGFPDPGAAEGAPEQKRESFRRVRDQISNKV